jgi:transposase
MRAEILVGPERRRRWSAEEKSRIVAEASLPGARVAEVARRHDVSRNLIYSWRRAATRGCLGDVAVGALPDLVPVVVSAADGGLGPDAAAAASKDGQRRSRAIAETRAEGAIEVALPGETRRTVRGRVEERTLRAVIRALRRA